jgi:hypothetical protein
MPSPNAVILLARNEGAMRRARALDDQVTRPSMQRAIAEVLTVLRGVPEALRQVSERGDLPAEREAIAQTLQAQAAVLERLELLVRVHGPAVEWTPA